MTTILDALAAHARERVLEAQKHLPAPDLERLAAALPKGEFAFVKALAGHELALLCE